MNIKDLFTFPIVMVDGENEERKEKDRDRLGDIPGQDDSDTEYDIVEGEARYSYHDYIGAEDRWLPTQKSLRRALRKKFDACIVRFDNIGQFLVPLTKEEFEEKIQAFADSREEEPEEFSIELSDPDSTEEIIEKIREYISNEKNKRTDI